MKQSALVLHEIKNLKSGCLREWKMFSVGENFQVSFLDWKVGTFFIFLECFLQRCLLNGAAITFEVYYIQFLPRVALYLPVLIGKKNCQLKQADWAIFPAFNGFDSFPLLLSYNFVQQGIVQSMKRSIFSRN